MMLRLGAISQSVIICSLLLLSACQSSNVIVDYDTSADFSAIGYYQLQPQNSEEKGYDPLMDERTQVALSKALPQKGLIAETSQHTANIIISYRLRNKVQEQEPNSGASIGIGGSSNSRSAVGLSLSFPLGDNKIVRQVQIIVDFLNPSDKALMWRASKSLTLSDEYPDQITAIIEAAIHEMLSFYPPGSKPQ